VFHGFVTFFEKKVTPKNFPEKFVVTFFVLIKALRGKGDFSTSSSPFLC